MNSTLTKRNWQLKTQMQSTTGGFAVSRRTNHGRANMQKWEPAAPADNIGNQKPNAVISAILNPFLRGQ
jgi:hypothetical protein